MHSRPNFTLSLMLFGFGFLAISLGQPLGIGQLPLSFLLKDRFGFTASDVAIFASAISIPFYFKPLAGLFADTFLSRSTHRQQLMAVGIVGACIWGFVPVSAGNLPVLLAFLFLAVCAAVFANTLLGGLMVEFGQNQQATGRLSAVRISAEGFGLALAGLAGGYLAGRPIWQTAIACAVCLLGLAALAPNLAVQRDVRHERIPLRQQIATLARAHDLWLIVLILFLVLVAPGLRTTLLFFQTDHLHFSKQFIGTLTFVNGICTLVGAGLYAAFCRRLPVRKLVWFGIAAYLLATLSYLGYRSPSSALIIEAMSGFALAAAALPVVDLAARSCPKNLEASAFGVILSVTNIALAISDVLGATLYTRYHVSFYHLVWFNLATTLIAVPFVMRLPARLTDQRDS